MSDENISGPYKNEGETVYATEPIVEQDDSAEDESDVPVYKDKEWLHYQYHILGKSMIDMANLAGVSDSTILTYMREYEIPRRDKSAAVSKAHGTPAVLSDDSWLRKHYVENEMSCRQISDMIDTPQRTVYSALEDSDVPLRDASERAAIRNKSIYEDEKYSDRDWLEFQYVTLQKSTGTIASENGWKRQTVYDWIEKHNIPTRSKKAAQLLRRKKEKGAPKSDTTDRELVSPDGIDASWTDIQDIDQGFYVQYRDRKWLKSQLERGLSYEDIAEKCRTDVGSTTIGTWIHRFNLTTGESD